MGWKRDMFASMGAGEERNTDREHDSEHRSTFIYK